MEARLEEMEEIGEVVLMEEKTRRRDWRGGGCSDEVSKSSSSLSYILVDRAEVDR